MEMFPIGFGNEVEVIRSQALDRSLPITESGLQVTLRLHLGFLSPMVIMVSEAVMEPIVAIVPAEWYSSTSSFLSQLGTQFMLYLPRILGALLIFLIGVLIAKIVKNLLIKLLEALRLSKMIKNTPIEHFFENADMGQKIEVIIGTIAYWLVMLVVLQASVSILGLESVSNLLGKILAYLPNVISAIIILFFGVLVAGVVESIVKGSIKTLDGRSSRMLGKIASYLVMTIAVMAAISELGIASEFILILFIGFVAMLSLGFGLALGLGGQDMVRKMLNTWYNKTMDDIKE